MEFDDLGEHCSICRLKDFLPFKCDKCEKFYCLEHRKHSCDEERLRENQVNEFEVKIIEYPRCGYRKCNNKLFNDYYCKECFRSFCVKHRVHEVHKKLIYSTMHKDKRCVIN